MYSVMVSLGEMATYIPVPGAFTAYANRFVDPSLSFAMGWIYWFSCAYSNWHRNDPNLLIYIYIDTDDTRGYNICSRTQCRRHHNPILEPRPQYWNIYSRLLGHLHLCESPSRLILRRNRILVRQHQSHHHCRLHDLRYLHRRRGR